MKNKHSTKSVETSKFTFTQMKNLSFFALLVFSALSFYSCQDPIEEEVNKNLEPIIIADTVFQFAIRHDELSGKNDSTKNFDWENIEIKKAIIRNGLGQTVETNLTLPWKTQGNPLNQVNPGIYKADGWDLVSVNFGSQEIPVDRPYLTMYNKEKRRFYLFVSNARYQAGSYAVGKLILNASDPDSMFSLDSKQAKVIQFDSWFNFEFEIPEGKTDPFLTDSDWVLLGTGVQIYTIHQSGN